MTDSLDAPLHPANDPQQEQEPATTSEVRGGDIIVIVKSSLLTGTRFHNLPRFGKDVPKPTNLSRLTDTTWNTLNEEFVAQANRIKVHSAIGFVFVGLMILFACFQSFYLIDVLIDQTHTELLEWCALITFIVISSLCYYRWFWNWMSIRQEIEHICNKHQALVQQEGYQLEFIKTTKQESQQKHSQNKFRPLRVKFRPLFDNIDLEGENNMTDENIYELLDPMEEKHTNIFMIEAMIPIILLVSLFFVK